jgi:presenilin-like A22 family membrane protease
MRQGPEVRFLKSLPELHLALLVPSLAIAVFSRDEFIIIMAVGVAMLWGLTLTVLAVACMVITLLKGPQRRRGSGAR